MIRKLFLGIFRIARVNYFPEVYCAAKRILGDDFISPEEVMASRPGVHYDKRQLKALVASIPSAAVQQLKDNGFALVPQPPHPLTLLNICMLESGLFHQQDWYKNQQFATNEKTGAGWIAVKKIPVLGSTNQTWDEQKRLLKEDETVPNAAEMSWFITTFLKVRGVSLFESIYVRCSDLDLDGRRVGVGHFIAEGLVLLCDFRGGHFKDQKLAFMTDRDGSRLIYLGLGCVRKF